MSVQPLTPPDPPPLLAVVSSIMDFPAPGIASPEDYARLVQQLGRLCPLQHFAMLGLADGGLHWLYEHQLPETFKQQLGREEPRLTEQLTRLDEQQGWCVQAVEHYEVQW